MLPINEVDSVYADPVPICRQLSTRVGPLDLLYITRTGSLVIVEAKLWRNPEARRKVVGQIIDYAAELSRWNYEDLDREVAKRTGHIDNALFSLAQAVFPELDEAEFADNVARSLRDGRFLLLVCGDGIREELTSMAEFLERNTTLDMTFGLVELAIFQTTDRRRLILPRVLAKTVTIKRQVIRVEGNTITVKEDQDEQAAVQPKIHSEAQKQYVDFWSDLVAGLHFDDPRQPPPTIARAANTSLRLPSPQAWITLYFSSSSGKMGIFLTFNRGEPGSTFYERLLGDRSAVEAELPSETIWMSDGEKHSIGLHVPLQNILDPVQRDQSIAWFRSNSNLFVNAFRPRIARYLEEI
jgi:hypothetical protein